MPIPISPIGILRKLFLMTVLYFGSEYCGKPIGPIQCAVLGYMLDSYFFFMSVQSSIAAISILTLKAIGHDAAIDAEKDN